MRLGNKVVRVSAEIAVVTALIVGGQRDAMAQGGTPSPSAPAAVLPEGPRDRRESGYELRGCTTEERDINPDCRRELRGSGAKSPRESAPMKLEGYWVSMVVEDWRFRMVTPPKGDFASLPLNDEAKKVADTWDPKNPQTCKAFGAAGLMRNPMRIKFEWENDTLLAVETDHGSQRRGFHFDAADTNEPQSMQGTSVASWENGGLKVVTTNLLAGYLRKNGVPYSEKTLLTEYYTTYSAFGQEWLTVMTVVNDPVYLTREFITTTDFKKLGNGADWHPAPCDGTSR